MSGKVRALCIWCRVVRALVLFLGEDAPFEAFKDLQDCVDGLLVSE